MALIAAGTRPGGKLHSPHKTSVNLLYRTQYPSARSSLAAREKKSRKIGVAFWPFKKVVNAPPVQNGVRMQRGARLQWQKLGAGEALNFSLMH